MNQRRLELLQAMPVFGGVRRETLELLLPRVDPVHRRPAEFFFRQDEHGTNVFVLERGRVAMRKRFEGRDLVLGEAGPGDCFGEVALLDFGPRTASVLALEECSALEIEARDLLEVLRGDAEQFALIYMNLGRELARRLRSADERLIRAHAEGSEHSRGYELRLI